MLEECNVYPQTQVGYVWNTLIQWEHDFKAFQSLKRLTMAVFMFEIETTFSDNKPCGQRTDCNNDAGATGAG